MYRTEESTRDIVGIFRCLLVIRRPGALCPPCPLATTLWRPNRYGFYMLSKWILLVALYTSLAKFIIFTETQRVESTSASICV